jgi:hypothetical protein
VPFGSGNVIVPVVDVFRVPFKVTDHEVPDGRPLSVNVTAYVTSVNVTDTATGPPFTTKGDV